MDIPSVTTGLGVVTVSLLVSYVVFMSRKHRIFKKLSVPGPNPWPAVGNFPEMAKIGIFEFQLKYYDKYKEHKVYGYHDPGCPQMVIRDLDLLRDVTIKHFNKFVNRRPFLAMEYPFDKVMVNLHDENWREVRQAISPTFSTGKLRRMCQYAENCAGNLKAYFMSACESGTEVELKDTMGCYSMDVIASAGFGVDIDSLKDRSSPFFQAVRKIEVSGWKASFLILFPFFVRFITKLGWRAFHKESVQFFCSFVDHSLESRKHESTKRMDFLQILVDAEKTPQILTSNGQQNSATSTGKKLTHDEIMGQAVIFLLASFDTVAIVLSFGLFAIAHHPHVCLKIQEEIDEVLGKASPTYDNVSGLVYLEQCVNEAVRMFPSIAFVDRLCSEDCELNGVYIPKGMVVQIPIFAIHRSSEHWPDPDTFDPDRFKPENKESRHPLAHIGFGVGPRNCLGQRLALLEIKIALASILQTMTPMPTERCPYPPRLSKYQMRALDNLWVKMTLRK